MKMKLQTLLSVFALALLFSCKKENISAFQTSSLENSDDEQTVFIEKRASSTTVTIRPGKKDGQDTYVSKIANDPNDGNANFDFTHELCMAHRVTSNGWATWRSFIKFDSLAIIPETSTIMSAQLYLYGVSSSITFPGGNTYPNPGLPKNSCTIQRVIGSNWDEHTLTWNTQPATIKVGQSKIEPSTSKWNYDAEVDVTQMVKEMVAHQDENYGFCIKLGHEESVKTMIFGTSEVSDKSKRPKLVVEYQ